MEVIKGVVQQVSIKERRSGQYGDWASYGIKINDSWYNGALNADKQSNDLILKDKDYVTVTSGMEVEFLLVEKGGYTNVDQKTFKVLSSGSGAQQPPQQEKVPQNAPNSVMDMCVVSAVASAIGKLTPPYPSDIKEKVQRMAKVYYKQYNEWK